MRMSPHIYKRRDGRFEGRYADGFKPDGKRRYRSVFARNYNDCKRKLETAKQELRSPASHHRQTIAETVSGYLDSIENQRKPSTIGLYRQYITRYIVPHFGNAKCVAVTPDTAQDFVNTLTQNGLAAQTVRSVFSLLRTALQRETTLVVTIPKPGKHEPIFFTLDEQKRLEQAAKGDSIDHFAVQLGLYAGLRVGEMCGLQWEDLDENGVLHIRRTLQRIPNPGGCSKTKIALLPPKSESSNRAIPLPPSLHRLLQKTRENSDCAYILSRNGKPVEPRMIQAHFKKLCAAAGVRSAGVHALRHTFACRALEQGFDLQVLAECLGHSSAVVSMRYYGNVTDTRKRTCMERLDAVFAGEG